MQMSDPSVERPSSLRMIISLTLVSVLSGVAVVSVYLYTKPIIDENKRLAIEAAVLQVIPGATEYQPFVLEGNELQPAIETKSKGQLFYAGYDQSKQLVGLAAPTNAQGYADKVYIIYGYRFDCECITGVKVIKHAETPGLGDKVITDKNFVANFDALDARVNADSSALQNRIITVKHGTKSNPWEVDAISGATITSRAIGKALDIGAGQLLPQVLKFRDQMEAQQP
ncbi:MAG: FMN-binding protein [Gammaproteobacteria bacterium]|nr:FMN-binding protein [Gammaproteobacteria bacterium]